MIIRTDRFLLSVLVLFAALALVGCGGGGGGGTGSPSSAATAAEFGADFHVVTLALDASGAFVSRARWGRYTPDTEGELDARYNRNTDGTVATSLTTSWLYAVDADGGLRWQSRLDPDIDALAGGLAADRNAFVLGSVESGSTPEIYIGARKGGLWNDSSLSGRYHVAGLFSDTAGTPQGAVLGEVTFDGAGGISSALDLNIGGLVLSGGTGTSTYSVQTDGRVTWNISSSYTVTGGIHADGGLIVLAGGTGSGDDPTVVVLVPADGATSDATLSGTYRFVGLEATLSGSFEARTGVMSADGAGLLDVELTNNADGVVSEVSSSGVAYSVTVDGSLTLSGGTTLEGGVSPDGGFFVLAGGTSSGDAPTLVIGIR